MFVEQVLTAFFFICVLILILPSFFQTNKKLKRPNPPTEEAIKRAQFVDKTYVWKRK